MVQWLRLHASTAEGTGLIPGQGTKILYSLSCDQKKKKDECKRQRFACDLPSNTCMQNLSPDACHPVQNGHCLSNLKSCVSLNEHVGLCVHVQLLSRV